MSKLASPITLPDIHHDGPHSEVKIGRLTLHFCKTSLVAFALDGVITAKEPHSRSAHTILDKIQGKGDVAKTRRLNENTFLTKYEKALATLEETGLFPSER